MESIGILSEIQRKTTQWYFRLVLVENLALFTFMVSIPGDPKNAWVLGLSRSRFLILSLVILVILASAVLVIISSLKRDWLDENVQRMAFWIDRAGIYLAAIILLALAAIVGVIALRFGAISTDAFILGYYTRLRPLVFLGVVISLQSIFALRLFRSGFSWGGVDSQRKYFLSILLPIVLIAGFSIWVIKGNITGVKDDYNWGSPGVPILGEQVMLALGVVLITVLVYALVLHKFISSKRTRFTHKIMIALVLWVVAIWIWSSADLLPSYFSPSPRPPNYEYYPYSDAALYDQSAQRLLIGERFEPTVRRPLYSAFLALAQATGGIGMQAILRWQIPILALIPVVLFLLTERLHHYISALLVAILVIFHEFNAIAFAGLINVSHAKLVMTDLPTTLGVVGFTYVAVKWMQTEDERPYLPLIAGGLMGLTIMMRVQAIIILPPVVVLAWIASKKQPRSLLKETIFLAVGLILVVGPWVYRNWQLTGEMSFGTDSSQTGLIFQRYHLVGADQVDSQGLDHSQDDPSNSVLNTVWNFISHNPDEFFRFTSAHFANNQIATLLVLPARFSLVEDLKTYYELSPFWEGPDLKLWENCCWRSDYVSDLPYWDHWDGVLENESVIPVILNLVLISIGIGVLGKQHGFIGITPLVVALSYSLGSSLIRFSGWRFNLPVDWVGICFYAIGIGQIILWVGGWLLNRSFSSSVTQTAAPLKPLIIRVITGIACLLFFGISAAIPAAEMAIKPRYDPNRLYQDLVEIEDSLTKTGLDSEILLNGLQSGSLTGRVGRALYPRFYPAGEGEPGTGWPAFEGRDYSRLSFVLVGPVNEQVVQPLKVPPNALPHGADVLVIGCKENNLLNASLVIELGRDPVGILSSPTPLPNCP